MKIYASHTDNIRNILSQFVGQDIWVRIYYGKDCTYDFFAKFININAKSCTGYGASCKFSYDADGKLIANYDLDKSLRSTKSWDLKYIDFPESFELYTTEELFGEIYSPDYLH